MAQTLQRSIDDLSFHLTKYKKVHYIAAERILSARDIQFIADTLHNYIAHFHEMSTWLQTITVRTLEFMVAPAKTNTEDR